MAPTKIAVLDDYHGIAKPSFDKLDKSKYEFQVFSDTLLPYNHPATPEHVKAQFVERLKPFNVICCMRERTPMPAEVLKQLPNLKLLLTSGTRNRSFDLPEAKELGIQIAGADGKGRSDAPKATVTLKGPDSTTQHGVALILGLARNLADDDYVVKTGGWQTHLATGLTGKTFGAVGFGKLGVNTAKILYQSFGMKVIAWSANLTQERADEDAKAAGLPVLNELGEKTFKVVSKEELFKSADVVSLHYVLSERTRGLITKDDLALMKESALLVNTSRGPLIVEEDLLAVLAAGKIRGAAIDVYEIEPLPADSPWRTLKWGREGRSNVLLSPHMGYAEENIMKTWYEQMAENIERWSEGKELISPMN